MPTKTQHHSKQRELVVNISLTRSLPDHVGTLSCPILHSLHRSPVNGPGSLVSDFVYHKESGYCLSLQLWQLMHVLLKLFLGFQDHGSPDLGSDILCAIYNYQWKWSFTNKRECALFRITKHHVHR